MKKIFAFVLALCMIFSLTACGGESEVETEPVETVVYAATEPVVEETLPPETEETVGFVPSPEATIPEGEPLHPEDYTFPAEDAEEITVYVTKSGEKYHTESCRWGDIPMLISEAIAAGYESCDKCF